jgi:hypothetical protein
MRIEAGQLRKWAKNYGDCIFLVLSLEDEIFENGDGVAGFMLNPVARVMEENGTIELYDVKLIETGSEVMHVE